MIARAGADCLGKVVDVDVLNLYTALRNNVRHKDVIELLVLLVENVGVSFDWFDTGDFVYLRKDTVEGRENGTRHDEFIAVSTNNDIGVGVLGEN